jgi:hypothetical protein
MVNSLLSRGDFSALLIGAPAILKGQQATSQAARIKVDTDHIIGRIDPKLYGNFIEHLGRCMEGGVFDEGSRLSEPLVTRAAMALRAMAIAAGSVCNLLLAAMIALLHLRAERSSAARADVSERLALLRRKHVSPTF